MNKSDILQLFYIEKNYSRIKEELKNNSESWSFNILARIALMECDIITAYKYFSRINSDIGCCYCKFLNNNYKDAKKIIKNSNKLSEAMLWLNFLIEFIENDVHTIPSYFQIRNFYEQDLELLFVYDKKLIIKNIIDKNLFLEKFNREIYKYSGRVFKNNCYYDIATKLLKKSLSIIYNDPETHYLLGEIYLSTHKYEEAKKEFKISSEIDEKYEPAIIKLKDFSNGLYNFDYDVK